ncbi:MAG: tRNA (adenosine(37)-N6)-threonylcarbamoyltransferase complex dimerization subunit type 1 TsaB [Sphingomonadaceae bacterium]|nr:tRNA (adenosine(37)-N6)-threonylcarbamoyltransferase complex dimerization subunit type 1 TsaB [Sphingomonadaceae bacterium]
MRTLVIDCSTEVCSVALFDGSELIDGKYEMLGRGHAERLVPMIAELPGKGEADRIAAALGPGSFTGVRVGIAAARALAFAWGAQLTGYPTLALVAAMARHEVGDEDIGVAMTGGHGEWFTQGFSPSGDTQRAFASLSPDAASAQTLEHVVAGTQAKALVDIRGSGKALDIWPDARAFTLLRPELLSDRAEPIYGRAPDAQIPAA